jgi:hypothetical protein
VSVLAARACRFSGTAFFVPGSFAVEDRHSRAGYRWPSQSLAPRARPTRLAPTCQAPARGLASGLTVCSSGRRSVYQAQVIVAAGAA